MTGLTRFAHIREKPVASFDETVLQRLTEKGLQNSGVH